MLYLCTYASPVGELTLCSDGTFLKGLWMDGQKYFGESADLPDAVSDGSVPVFDRTRIWLDRYFAGEEPDPKTLPLRPDGSPFRQAVWNELLKIPYGRTVTYGDISRNVAHLLGKESMSAQAVGGAVGHNPISIIIPCHRVVGSGGSLTGYAGGLDRKIWLLCHEGNDMSGMYVPKKGTAL